LLTAPPTAIALGQQGRRCCHSPPAKIRAEKGQSADPDQIRILLEGAQASPAPHAEQGLPAESTT